MKRNRTIWKKLYMGMIIAVIISSSCINQGSGQIGKTESNNKVLTYDVKAKDEKLLESIKRTDVPANISYNVTTYMGEVKRSKVSLFENNIVNDLIDSIIFYYTDDKKFYIYFYEDKHLDEYRYDEEYIFDYESAKEETESDIPERIQSEWILEAKNLKVEAIEYNGLDVLYVQYTRDETPCELWVSLEYGIVLKTVFDKNTIAEVSDIQEIDNLDAYGYIFEDKTESQILNQED